jgi:hypothetical protein
MEEWVKLKLYIRKCFSSKAEFLSFLQEKLNITLPQNILYESLLPRLDSLVRREDWLSTLGLKSLEEAEIRAYLFDALYEGLPEWPVGRQLSPLYQSITGERIKLRRKFEKKEPAKKLAFQTSEEEFTRAWIQLSKEGKVPFLIHYKMITVGALGWLKSPVVREKSLMGGYTSEVMELIDKKFDQKSQNIIINCLVAILQDISKDPGHFGFSGETGRQMASLLKIIKREKEEYVKYLMTLQLIHTYLSDEDFIEVINSLIASSNIKPPKVKGFYERFPYSFSI